MHMCIEHINTSLIINHTDHHQIINSLPITTCPSISTDHAKCNLLSLQDDKPTTWVQVNKQTMDFFFRNVSSSSYINSNTMGSRKCQYVDCEFSLASDTISCSGGKALVCYPDLFLLYWIMPLEKRFTIVVFIYHNLMYI